MNAGGYDICVIGGLGHVGLPLALLFADAGRKVVAYDVDTQRADEVRAGRMPFLEEQGEETLRRVLGRTFDVSTEIDVVGRSRVLFVVIGTPVDEYLNPQFTLFLEFFEQLLPQLHDDQHVVLCSTVFPGTTERVRDFLARRGKRPRLSFCPERVAQGKSLVEHRQLPQIVSSFDPESAREVRELFSLLTTEIVTLDPPSAELAKLFTNVWRYVQFAVSNEFYQIATSHGLEYARILHAVKHQYPRAGGLVGAGFAAGPCLFKDTMQLAAFAEGRFFLGHAAMLVNEGLPNFVVRGLLERHDLSDKTVGILGMAFKANNDDRRASLSYKLRKILDLEARRVLCSDIYISEPGMVPADVLVAESDVIVVGAPHREYAELRIPPDKVLVDVWNFFERGTALGAG
jgi:UDP-N-acetyl-D-mannosaminuronic acid dehydrogenase